VNVVLDRMWKKPAVAYFTVVSAHLLRTTEHKHVRLEAGQQDNRTTGPQDHRTTGLRGEF
jgi:hypothetical protein